MRVMDKQAAIPPTLPRPHPITSGWQDPPDAIADLRSTAEVPETADVVVIGSGISGASIALGLLESGGSPNVVMLEARQACSGATGRNGGHTKGASYRGFYDNVETIGAAEAIKVARLDYNNIKAVHDFARLHAIECESAQRQTVDIIYDQGQWDNAVRSIELIRKLMPDDLEGAARYTLHSSADARDKFLCAGDNAVGAISYEAGSLSAYKFVIGLLKLCLEKGLNLQTHTSATALRREPDGTWRTETSRGGITARRVVLATNAYTAYLYPKLHAAIVPLRGQISVHRPGINMPKEGLQATYSFIYAKGYEYMISRPLSSEYAGDIIMGGGLVKAPHDGLFEYGTTDDTTLNTTIHDYLVQTTPRYFGKNWGDDHPDGRIRSAWTGIMGYSPDGFPFIGEIPNEKGLYISASFQGSGMTLCFLCGKALVQMMHGEDTGLNTWFPDIFQITAERMHKKFEGRLHTKQQDLELKFQP